MPRIHLNAIPCSLEIRRLLTLIHIQDKDKNPSARIEHEASTSKIGEDQLFYFLQRGIDYERAVAAMISGFCRGVFNELPDEFGAEVNNLMSIKLETPLVNLVSVGSRW